MEMLQLIDLSGNIMISLFELGHVDPIPVNFVYLYRLSRVFIETSSSR